MDKVVQTCWDGYEWLWEEALAIYRRDRDPVPVLLAESKACPWMGWRMCVELVIGCAQRDGWKITSVKPSVEWFLSGSGSEGSHIRSL